MDSLTCHSRAKLNLFLEIKGKRSDGYHEIETLFQEISIGDEISLRKIQGEYSVLKCSDTTVPLGRRNLCIKAYEIVREEAGLTGTVEISLDKTLPLGAGLGGGSSNGACIIRALNELYELGMTDERMAELALKVGSDVPFFIYGGTAVGRGRGGEITKLPSPASPFWFTVIKPAVSVSTGNAYQWVKRYKGKKVLDEAELSRALEAADLDFFLKLNFNAFEGIVFKKHPELEAFKKELVEAGCLKACMTGCGSAMYGFCEDEKAAEKAAAAFSGREDIIMAAACHTV